MNQTYENFEVFLIDDGSTDNSLSLCQKFERDDKRIKVFHTENKGVGPARNIGIENAKGKYITFFDIDDTINPNSLEIIERDLRKCNYPELIMWSYREIDISFKTSHDYIFENKYFDSNQALKENYIEEISSLKFNNGFIWNKAYRRDFIINNNLRFRPLRIQQDEVFNLDVYKRAETIRLCDRVLYNYFVYPKGNIRSYFIQERLSIYKEVKKTFEELINHWGLKNKEFNKYVKKRFLDSVIMSINYNLFQTQNDLSKEDKFRKVKEILQDVTVKKESKEFLEIYGAERSFEKFLYLSALSRSSFFLYQAGRLYSSVLTSSKLFVKKIFGRR